jgi:serine/threonine protein kinase
LPRNLSSAERLVVLPEPRPYHDNPMMSVQNCPQLPDLQRFLLGQDAEEEAGQIESHLGCCRECLAVMDGLEASDPFIEAAQAQATMVNKPPQTVRVEGLIRQLKELYPSTTAFAPAGDDYAGYLAPAQSDDEIGRLGTYRIRRLIGMGGMGVVFLAEDLQLQREVALKLLRPSLLGNAQARLRFLREARATATVTHDHIVPIYQVGEDRDVPFLAMPMLQGETLADRLTREGRLPAEVVIHIGREIALGLAAAHARGLVHRDVKPGNIWLEPITPSSGNRIDLLGHERVRLLDFGLAQVPDSQLQLTEIGMIMGTPAYMAPEQARGETVDARCDLFSLGSVLYAMVAGRPPFQGENNLAMLHSICADSPPSLRELGCDIPESLIALIENLHAKDRADRCQSAQDAADCLERCQGGSQQKPAPKKTGFARPRRWLVAAVVLLALGGLTMTVAGPLTHLGSLLSHAFSGRMGAPVDPEFPPKEPPGEGDDEKGSQPAPALAVLVFEERGAGAKDLGPQVSDLLFAKLAAKDGIPLVDRADLQKVFAELKLGLSGAVKPDSAARVAQLTGARLLLWGSVLHVDKRRYLIAKLVSAETGQILGLSVDAPATDELGPQVGKLADQVAEALATKSDQLLPKVQARVDRLEALKKQLGNKVRPILWVGVPERAVGITRVPDPAAQTEIVKLAKDLGFPVVDAEEGAKGMAAILVTGEGVSEVGGRHGDLVTVKARLEVKAVDRATGKVLAVDRQVVVVVDVTEQLAGKAALQQAAADIAARILPKLVAKD